MPKNKIKLKSTSNGIFISTKNASLSQIKFAFDDFILKPKKKAIYYLKDR